MTIKGLSQRDSDAQEQTIRPIHKRSPKDTAAPKPHQRVRSSPSRPKTATVASTGPKSPSKSNFGSKFELLVRPEELYREQNVDDYSDLFVENDSVFSQGFNQAARRVHSPQLPIRRVNNN